ncbi:hypothetical protein Vafri_966, partial [Volvox africanus]
GRLLGVGTAPADCSLPTLLDDWARPEEAVEDRMSNRRCRDCRMRLLLGLGLVEAGSACLVPTLGHRSTPSKPSCHRSCLAGTKESLLPAGKSRFACGFAKGTSRSFAFRHPDRSPLSCPSNPTPSSLSPSLSLLIHVCRRGVTAPRPPESPPPPPLLPFAAATAACPPPQRIPRSTTPRLSSSSGGNAPLLRRIMLLASDTLRWARATAT